MKKLLLSYIIFFFTITLTNAQTPLVCNTFPDASNVSVYINPSPPPTLVSYGVNTGMNELNVAYNDAPSWSDWATTTAELKISFASTNITGLASPVVSYEIVANSIVLTGPSCGTSLPLGIAVVDVDGDYADGISSNIGYWVGLDTAHYTPINTSTTNVNYGAINTITIKPAIPAGCTVSGGFILRNLCIGEEPTTAIKKATTISNSALYPNPVSDIATIAMELNAVSEVKITLSDMMGKEMMTIIEGNMSSINTNINVANLNKGIYAVNYIINGAAAKSELLMVK